MAGKCLCKWGVWNLGMRGWRSTFGEEEGGGAGAGQGLGSQEQDVGSETTGAKS